MPSARRDDVYIPSHKHSRSRSPIRHSRPKRQRSRSPQRARHHDHHHHQSHTKPSSPGPLPYERAALHKHDLKPYEALFAEYLAVQKNIGIHDLTREEVKGRWKSFLGKWNRGELAEGWYDPAFGKRCQERYVQNDEDEDVEGRSVGVSPARRASREPKPDELRHDEAGTAVDQDDEADGYGPALPDTGTGRSHGPVIPRLQDLQERREQLEDDYDAQRTDMRFERKHERQVQKERLEDLAPRAEPGTRERQLEKKRDVAASNRAFKDAKEAGDVEVKDGELMGDDGAEAYKAEKKKREKVKNERELRKEEILRARAAERENRMAQMRGKEEKTMDMLRGLAKARFG